MLAGGGPFISSADFGVLLGAARPNNSTSMTTLVLGNPSAATPNRRSHDVARGRSSGTKTSGRGYTTFITSPVQEGALSSHRPQRGLRGEQRVEALRRSAGGPASRTEWSGNPMERNSSIH